MNKNKFSSYFIFLSIFTFITLLSIIIQKSYFNLKKHQEKAANNALLKEINPTLDLSVFSEIESKSKNIEDNFNYSILKEDLSSPTTPSVTPFLTPTTTLTEAPIESAATSPNQLLDTPAP